MSLPINMQNGITAGSAIRSMALFPLSKPIMTEAAAGFGKLAVKYMMPNKTFAYSNSMLPSGMQ